MAEIAQVSNAHHAIIDWLLANPEKNYDACATAMGYTRSWLSTIIHSDAFKAEYARRRGLLDQRINEGIVSKTAAVAKKALDKLDVLLDDDELDPRLVLDAGDKMLHRLGYAPSKGGAQFNIQQNNFVSPVQKDTLTLAREAMNGITATPLLESK